MRAVVAAVAVGLSVLALVGVAGRASASMTMLEDGRYVSVDSLTPIRPSPGFPPFGVDAVGAHGAAFQASLISGDGTLIEGDGSVSLVGLEVVAQSVLALRFTVDAVQSFGMTGTISGVPGASAFFADSNGIFQVLGGDLGLTGVLQPGTEYTLFVGLMDDAGSFHVEFAVPEPSLAILLLGLAPLLARRVLPRAGR